MHAVIPTIEARPSAPIAQTRREARLTPRRSRRPIWATATVWVALGAYGLALALIGLWPTEVDAPARGMLADITRAVPWLTYARIEFTANILLFVPFGVLFSLLLPRARWRWCAIVLAAAAFSVSAEWLQTLADDRTSSALDVVANTLGAAIGIAAVAMIRVSARAMTSMGQGRPIP